MIFLIDSGHGGIIDGKYVTAPAKMFTHPGHEPFYEGVFNRKIKNMLFDKLDNDDIRFIDLCPSELDLRLASRCYVANSWVKQKPDEKFLLISLHSNAGGGRGFEIFTSPGVTKSDTYATKFVEIFRRAFPAVTVRMDMSDKDPDKEEKFTMLTAPICPSILPEFLFYDNYEDYLMLIDKRIQILYVEMLRQFCNEANKMIV